jgi:hypothetical protein
MENPYAKAKRQERMKDCPRLYTGLFSLKMSPPVLVDDAPPLVRKTPSWPRSWANFSLLSLYSHRNARANLHRLGQPNTFLAQAGWVNDGPDVAVEHLHFAPNDVDYQTSNEVIQAHWHSWEDEISGIYGYRCAVGTAPLSDDVVSWFFVAKETTCDASIAGRLRRGNFVILPLHSHFMWRIPIRGTHCSTE